MSDRCQFCGNIEKYPGYDNEDTEYVCSRCVCKMISTKQEYFDAAVEKASLKNQTQHDALLMVRNLIIKEEINGTRDKEHNNGRRTNGIIRNTKSRNASIKSKPKTALCKD